ncbi:uncharacterized protein KY384_001178 [Bacidia gigantensis]|uniref:uncharacterized protein n=1 Tax=Bacidia gigantensis TaxID=2732470 RepID=UPI001D04AAC9|nr:uncharacterized protein KY384_001178 [Bacidia gigantensis]KAG8534334.1 hypothetical protein KY384_001178 [Bacidia gigantensis]
MASQITPEGNVIAPLNISAPAPMLDLRGFKWDTVDEKIQGTHHREDAPPAPKQQVAALPPQLEKQLEKPKDSFLPSFPLEQFHGTYAGNGFNLIWRPRANDDATFPTTSNASAKTPVGPNDNILELNLTREQLTFGENIGKIPNRGFLNQPDINLAGLPYLQTVQDVTFPTTGKGDNPIATSIHFEPGVWLNVPKSKVHEKPADSVTRMACIPHGTTINAQGLVPPRATTSKSVIGGDARPPNIQMIDTTPFKLGNPNNRLNGAFPSMDAANPNTFRIPQDLKNFVRENTITSEIIKNPHQVLLKAIKNQVITETITIEVSTGLPTATINGGGISNISFLMGKQNLGDNNAPSDPVAHAAFMTSTFWIERVQYQVHITKSSVQSTQRLFPDMSKSPDAPTPEFLITTPRGGVPKDITITIPSIQIQYSQTVNLNFGLPGNILTWPHVSVATLVPSSPQPFQMT